MAGPTLAEVETESLSVGDTMRAIVAADETPAAEEADDAAEASEVAEAPAADAGAAQRARDERGRFAKAGEPEPEPDGDGAEPADAQPASEPEAELEPPTDWPLADQEQFRSFPAPARQMLLARTNEARDARQVATAWHQYHQGLESILGPRRETFARDGLDDAGAVRQIFSISDFAAKWPVDFMRWYAQQRGLTPDQIWPQQNQQPEDDSLIAGDPLFQKTQQELSQLRSVVANWQRAQEQQSTYAQQQAQQSLVSEVQNFAGAVDDKGRPQYPYFQNVRSYMGALIGSGDASDLKSAYDMACRAHPEVYAKINAAAQAKAVTEQAKAARVKAQDARRAGSSIAGTPGERGGPVPTGDVYETMRRIAADAGAL